MHIESVLKKLRHKTNTKAVILNAPANIEQEFMLAGLSPSIEEFSKVEFCLVFAHSRAEVEELVPMVGERLETKTTLWLAYPKLTSKLKSDLHRDKLWSTFETFGLRPVSMIAIDETWSAIRFMPPKK